MSTNARLAAHTPGPWKIRELCSDGAFVGTEKATIAKVYVDEANARLIAAAPEIAKRLVVTARRYHEQSAHDDEREDGGFGFETCPDSDCRVNSAALHKAGVL
jgi:hypothetical protein